MVQTDLMENASSRRETSLDTQGPYRGQQLLQDLAWTHFLVMGCPNEEPPPPPCVVKYSRIQLVPGTQVSNAASFRRVRPVPNGDVGYLVNIEIFDVKTEEDIAQVLFVKVFSPSYPQRIIPDYDHLFYHRLTGQVETWS